MDNYRWVVVFSDRVRTEASANSVEVKVYDEESGDFVGTVTVSVWGGRVYPKVREPDKPAEGDVDR